MRSAHDAIAPCARLRLASERCPGRKPHECSRMPSCTSFDIAARYYFAKAVHAIPCRSHSPPLPRSARPSTGLSRRLPLCRFQGRHAGPRISTPRCREHGRRRACRTTMPPSASLLHHNVDDASSITTSCALLVHRQRRKCRPSCLTRFQDSFLHDII